MVDWVGHQREGILHAHLLQDIHLVSFSPPNLTFRLSQKVSKNIPQQLQSLLKKETGETWMIAISDEIGHPTLYEKAKSLQEERRNEILQEPLVKMLVEAFPGTSLVQIEDV